MKIGQRNTDLVKTGNILGVLREDLSTFYCCW